MATIYEQLNNEDKVRFVSAIAADIEQMRDSFIQDNRDTRSLIALNSAAEKAQTLLAFLREGYVLNPNYEGYDIKLLDEIRQTLRSIVQSETKS